MLAWSGQLEYDHASVSCTMILANKVSLGRGKWFANPEETGYGQIGELLSCSFQERPGDHKQSSFGSLATHSSGFCRSEPTRAAQKFEGPQMISSLLVLFWQELLVPLSPMKEIIKWKYPLPATQILQRLISPQSRQVVFLDLLTGALKGHVAWKVSSKERETKYEIP